ncbi:MAG: hypothetical protein ACUVRU_05325 [Anaerolineae bacterium]
MTQRRYGALRLIAFALQVVAWVSIILGLLSALGIFLAGAFSLIDLSLLGQPADSPTASLTVGIIGAIASLLVATVQFAGLLAASQMIYLLIDAEQNTRVAADALQHLLALQFIPTPEVTPATESESPPNYNSPDNPIPDRQSAEPTITIAAPPPTKR